MTRDKTRAKEKARAEPLIHEGEDSEEDAYGSDNPEHQNPSQEPDRNAAVDGRDGEVDGAPQGSPKGHKRSRINSAGQGAPVQVKAEKTPRAGHRRVRRHLAQSHPSYIPGSIVLV